MSTPEQTATTPPPASTPWVPMWALAGGVDLTGYQAKTEKAQANGYASLDATGKVPAAQLPASGSSASYGTTLPANPTDGQFAILVDSLANPSYQWQFRYNAGSSLTYKWEFVGGSSAYNLSDTGATGSQGGAWVLGGAGITVPRAGDYEVEITMVYNTSNGSYEIGPSVAGANPAVYYSNSGFASWTLTSSYLFQCLAVAASSAIKPAAHSTTSASFYMYRNVIKLRPIRVS